MEREETVIELQQVSQRYGKGELTLREVQLTVKRGEFVSVIGPSGAGKTTLLRVLNGAVPVCGGKVILFGTRFDTLRGKEKCRVQKRIGTIYQDFCLVEPSTCLDNVLNGALADMSLLRAVCGIFTKEQQERAREALDHVGLLDKADARAGSLSGGQKQRAAIARALMQRPELLLADEPIASLDPAAGAQVLELMKEIQQRQRLTVIMNSHNLESALKYSDRICGVSGGKIRFDVPVSKVNKEMLDALYQGTEEKV